MNNMPSTSPKTGEKLAHDAAPAAAPSFLAKSSDPASDPSSPTSITRAVLSKSSTMACDNALSVAIAVPELPAELVTSILVARIRLLGRTATKEPKSSLSDIQHVFHVQLGHDNQRDLMHAVLASFSEMGLDWASVHLDAKALDVMFQLHEKGRLRPDLASKWHRPLQYSDNMHLSAIRAGRLDVIQWWHEQTSAGVLVEASYMNFEFIPESWSHPASQTVDEDTCFEIVDWYLKKRYAIHADAAKDSGLRTGFGQDMTSCSGVWFAHAAARGFNRILQEIVTKLWSPSQPWRHVSDKPGLLFQVAQAGHLETLKWLDSYVPEPLDSDSVDAIWRGPYVPEPLDADCVAAIMRGAFERGDKAMLRWAFATYERFTHVHLPVHGNDEIGACLAAGGIVQCLQAMTDKGRVGLLKQCMDGLQSAGLLPAILDGHCVDLGHALAGGHVQVWTLWVEKRDAWGIGTTCKNLTSALVQLTADGRLDVLRVWWGVARNDDAVVNQLRADKKLFESVLGSAFASTSGCADLVGFWHGLALEHAHGPVDILPSWLALATGNGVVSILEWWSRHVALEDKYTPPQEIIFAGCSAGQVKAVEWWLANPKVDCSCVDVANLFEGAFVVGEAGTIEWLLATFVKSHAVGSAIVASAKWPNAVTMPEVASALERACAKGSKDNAAHLLDMARSLPFPDPAVVEKSVAEKLLLRSVEHGHAITLKMLLDIVGSPTEQAYSRRISNTINRITSPRVCVMDLLAKRRHDLFFSASMIGRHAAKWQFGMLDWCVRTDFPMQLAEGRRTADVTWAMSQNPWHPAKGWFDTHKRARKPNGTK